MIVKLKSMKKNEKSKVMKKMAQCKDCKFYKPLDDVKGDCFGHEVPANANVDKCPTGSFQQRGS